MFHSTLDAGEFARLSLAGWAVLSFTVVFSIVIAFFLWYRGVKKIGPSRTIIYQYSIPVFAAFFAYLLIQEQLYFLNSWEQPSFSSASGWHDGTDT
ncbi:MAG: DMT family transporter [Desulfomicrobium escambiense]|nr:DMT family transporter [Desulfomicrobium escambiense]